METLLIGGEEGVQPDPGRVPGGGDGGDDGGPKVVMGVVTKII